jgi:hypothetical protein
MLRAFSMTSPRATSWRAFPSVDTNLLFSYTEGHSARGLFFRSNAFAEEQRFRYARGLVEQSSTLE